MPEPTATPNQQNVEITPPVENETFESLMEKDPKIKAAYEQHAAGLLNTVKATREERDSLKDQLKVLLPKAEKGSELEKSLTEFSGKLEAAERRATFFEESAKPGIDCRNPKAAYALATTLEAFDKKGNPDWSTLKAEAPELFGKVTPPAHGGSGANIPIDANTINDSIRRAAGH